MHVASLSIALPVLFILGCYVGHFSHEGLLKFGVRYMLLGLVGAALSFLVGDILKDVVTYGTWVFP